MELRPPSSVAKRPGNRRGVPGWSDGRAGPEDAVFRVDALLGDPAVVGGAARAGPAQFVENRARSAVKILPAPSRSASAVTICASVRTPSGGGACAWRRRITRPSRLVIVPSSSAHCAIGSTTSARSAVSDRKKSATTRKSSASSRSCTWPARGAETTMLEPMTKSARTPPSVPSVSSSLVGRVARPRQVVGVDAPDAGDMRPVRGIVDLAVARQLVGLLAVLAPALAVALAGEQPQPQWGLPALPSASARLMKASVLSTPLLCCSGPRAVSTMAVAASPSRCAALISARGTPVIRSTRSGQ